MSSIFLKENVTFTELFQGERMDRFHVSHLIIEKKKIPIPNLGWTFSIMPDSQFQHS